MGRPKKIEPIPRRILNVSFSATMYQRLERAAAKRTTVFDRNVGMNELVRKAVDDFLRAEETGGSR